MSVNKNTSLMVDEVRSQDFKKMGYMDVYMPVCMHSFVTMQDWGYGGMLPKEIIFRCSEIASEAILEQSSPHIFKKKWYDSRLLSCRSLLAVNQLKANW